ncbi:hypothetical protein G6011_02947 [Alternaria panax]|uniref:Uncharacterized protein n=1 Tax=Alternaria panax TaxID=48097 RepID=A0AAD4FBY1_9PLEO|nr:hypothetical protein G6011_02947 [Alternaria panax]
MSRPLYVDIAQTRLQKTDPRYQNGRHPYDGAYDGEGQPQRKEMAPNTGEGKQRTSHSVAASGLLNATAARPDKGAMGEKAGGRGRAEHMAPRRKPWDPPFGKRREAGFEPLQTSAHVMENDWFVSSPAPPKKTGRELEAKGVARRLFPPEAEGTCAHDYEAHDGLVGFDRDATPRATPIPISESAPATGERVYMDDTKSTSSKKGRNKPGIISAVWMSVGICAVLLFILAFAILVAHCLAWFLVYKTEARLGEARRGIMQGGDMRLCLCAT